MPWEVKQNGEQFCVHKQGESSPIKGGCHDDQEDAVKHMQALYASNAMSEGGELAISSYLAFAENASVGDDGLLWVEALPAKTWYDPRWGDVPIDENKLSNFIKNFNENVRGQEVTTDYEHGLDAAKGKKASGTYRKFEIRPRGDGVVSLWAGIEPTPTALAEIKNKEWKYFSVEWEDEWTHPETKQVHQDVIVGGGLTNRPVAKGMMPINFSEVFIEQTAEEAKKFAVWSTAYVNNLPDSAFLFVESGGKKDSEGKTVPRSNRHLPYKDANGNVDLPHLRNAIARAPQMKDVPAGVVSRIQVKARKLLGAKSMAEILTIEAEMAPEEFQEPGTGFIDPSINADDSADEGWRRDTPPGGEDGTVPDRSDTVTPVNDATKEVNTLTEAELEELRTLIGINEHGDVVQAVKAMSEELKPLRELREQVEANKKFAEEYPDEAKRLDELEAQSQQQFAKTFSEAFETKRVSRKVGEGDEAKDEATTLGFSALVLDNIETCAKQFSEGAPTFDAFKGVLDSIFDNGIVDYGNKGSERVPEIEDTPTDRVSAGKQFNEKVMEIQKKDELTFEVALAEAAKQYPKLAEAWRNPPVVA